MSKKTVTRALRNNNPLNIRRNGRNNWKGMLPVQGDADFVQFTAMKYGWRAAFLLLSHYHKYHNCRTIADYIRRWAPPSENDTDAYIRIVSILLGQSPDGSYTIANSDDLRQMARQMGKVETGVYMLYKDLLDGWDLFTSDYPARAKLFI